jgi:acyl-CoA hydrolase
VGRQWPIDSIDADHGRCSPAVILRLMIDAATRIAGDHAGAPLAMLGCDDVQFGRPCAAPGDLVIDAHVVRDEGGMIVVRTTALNVAHSAFAGHARFAFTTTTANADRRPLSTPRIGRSDA